MKKSYAVVCFMFFVSAVVLAADRPGKTPVDGPAAPAESQSVSEAVQAASPNLRAALRVMAKKGVDISVTPEWVEFAKAKASGIKTKSSKAAIDDNEKLVREEIAAWRALPDEKVSKGRFPCSAATCKGLKLGGKGFLKAYFSDGFILRLEDNGNVIDLSYPAPYTRRAKLRARALAVRPRAMRSEPEWGGFIKELETEPRYGRGADAGAALTAEIEKWKNPLTEKVSVAAFPCSDTVDYCKEPGAAGGKYNTVSFSDGFVLALYGVKAADGYYKALETPESKE